MPRKGSAARNIRNLNELRDFVNQTLCGYDHLKPDEFRLDERVLLRQGKPCGLYFCLHGPRSTKYTAIWETDGNAVFFYSSSGERFLRTQLEHAPRLDRRAA